MGRVILRGAYEAFSLIESELREMMQYSKIHILGASGAGTTTLGQHLAEAIGFALIDTDDVYWEQKYSKAYPPAARLEKLHSLIKGKDCWILSGAATRWATAIQDQYDLVIFLTLPQEIRLERLKARETQRYGERILPGGDHHGHFLEFIDWASKYEAGEPPLRSRKQQEEWLEGLSCPILRLDSRENPEVLVQKVMEFISKKKTHSEESDL